MTGRGPDGPEDIDAAFAEIVAGLERDGLHARWPDQNELEALGPDAVGLFGEDETGPGTPGSRQIDPGPAGSTGPTGPTGTDRPDVRPFTAFDPAGYEPDQPTNPDASADPMAGPGPGRGATPAGDGGESQPAKRTGGRHRRHQAPGDRSEQPDQAGQTGQTGQTGRFDQLDDADDEHFVPPDPPPLPPMRTGTIAALALVALGILLLIAPSLIGLASSAATPLALISMSAGIGLLVLRMRQGPPPDSGWDDGAQV